MSIQERVFKLILSNFDQNYKEEIIALAAFTVYCELKTKNEEIKKWLLDYAEQCFNKIENDFTIMYNDYCANHSAITTK